MPNPAYVGSAVAMCRDLWQEKANNILYFKHKWMLQVYSSTITTDKMMPHLRSFQNRLLYGMMYSVWKSRLNLNSFVYFCGTENICMTLFPSYWTKMISEVMLKWNILKVVPIESTEKFLLLLISSISFYRHLSCFLLYRTHHFGTIKTIWKGNI